MSCENEEYEYPKKFIPSDAGGCSMDREKREEIRKKLVLPEREDFFRNWGFYKEDRVDRATYTKSEFRCIVALAMTVLLSPMIVLVAVKLWG